MNCYVKGILAAAAIVGAIAVALWAFDFWMGFCLRNDASAAVFLSPFGVIAFAALATAFIASCRAEAKE
jgi:hypothetical protein